jgi:hypothetical protein
VHQKRAEPVAAGIGCGYRLTPGVAARSKEERHLTQRVVTTLYRKAPGSRCLLQTLYLHLRVSGYSVEIL